MEEEFTKIEQAAALRIHDRAHKEAEKYAEPSGNIFMITHYGRGYKSGYMRGSQEMFELASRWWLSKLNGITSQGLAYGIIEEFRQAMEK